MAMSDASSARRVRVHGDQVISAWKAAGSSRADSYLARVKA